MQESTSEVDVAILGGGLAANLLARQLRREAPKLGVAVFEKTNPEVDPPRYKVGESTVEIATNYLVRRLGLSTYIYKEHLPKNGLRYFFDSPEKDAALPKMSEIGIHGLPPYPSFQLDRARFEPDLMAMNRADGVELHFGARVKDLQLGEGDEKHRFTVVTDAGEKRVAARWVVDCTGRESLVAKQKDLRLPEKQHKVAAAWGRVNGVRDMDDWDDEEWRAKARYTSRVLSTNHFMYDGYWIWFIPLRNGITSVGLVQERPQWDVARHKPEGFLSYLREHEAPRSLLEDAELIDLEAYTQLAFRTKQFFSADRWACVGDSAAFADPFYSPGSDFIAVENDLVADLIRRDVDGEDQDFAERVKVYDDFMHFRFETTMVIYDGQYPALGSYELFRAKVYFDTACYYNLLFDSYCRDEHRNIKWLRSTLRRKSWALQTMDNFRNLFSGAAAAMKERGTYHRQNLGHARLEGRDAFGVMEEVGGPRSRREINQLSEHIFQRTQKMVGEALDDDSALVERLTSGSRELYDAWSQLSQPAT